MNIRQAKFEDVKGYATYENAEKRGQTVVDSFAATKDNARMTWVVMALPNGRFAPCFIMNDSCSWMAGALAAATNVLVVN